tara:strand:- start:191 stop:757 length:567 start_codon:yes stop_codon:yes gene_type:complete
MISQDPYDKTPYNYVDRDEAERQRIMSEILLQQQRQSGAPQEAGGGGGMNPMQAYSNYQKFSGNGGGGLFGGGGGGAATGAETGGAATGGESSMLASAGPWAALAAVIAGNEMNARKEGRRDEDKATHLMDAFSGKVLEQDTEYYGDKVGGVGGRVIRGAGKIGHPEGQFNFAKKGIKNTFTPWKLFS